MRWNIFLFLWACLFSLPGVSGQKYYNTWTFGAAAGVPTFPNLRCVVDFNQDTVTTYPDSIQINSRGTNAAICDSSGKLALYTNGHFIADGSHNIIANGSDLNPNPYFDVAYQSYNCPGCHTFLPFGKDKYSLFHIGLDDQFGFSSNLRYLYRSDIVKDATGAGYEVVDKNTIHADGAYELYNLVKQGSGLTYWLVQPVLQQDSFNVFHVDADTMYLHHGQRIGPTYEQGSACYAPGINSISPDGSKYVRFNNKCGLWLYSLDRCTGLLSDPKEVPMPVKPMAAGACTQFSPNSRYLYFNSSTVVYQVDTEADILVSDTVAVYDGYVDPFATRFYMMSLMPDGKIYMTSTNGVLSLHVIEYPDSAGMACQVNQHSFPLPGFIAWGINRYPNVWLGSLECDTTSSNQFVQEVVQGIQIVPNPSSREARLILDGAEGHAAPWPIRVFDMQGREVYQGAFPPWSWIHRLDVSQWSSGMYFIQVYDGQLVRASGTLLVQRD